MPQEHHLLLLTDKALPWRSMARRT
uniref:Uncharacterized protein n=1 Tax=Arundo donax TaxID=35708 RepID=A0A0A8YYC7_ARUDO